MSSTAFGFRAGSAAFAFAVGMAVASSPGTAVADNSDANSASQPSKPSKSAVGTSRRAAQAHPAPKATAPKRSARVALTPRPVLAGRPTTRGPIAHALKAAASADSSTTEPRNADSGAVNLAAAEQVSATSSSASAEAAVSVPKAVAAQARQTATAALTPADVVSGFLSLFGIKGLPPSPVQLLTGLLALIRREIEAFLYPTAAVPSVSITDTSLVEGDAGTTDAALTLTLSKSSTKTVTVNYSTADGSATAGQDYTAGSGTVTFAPGVVTQVIGVAVLGDTVVEPDETFTVTLSNPSGATIARATATGTITDDDDATVPKLPSVSIADATVSEGDSATTAIGFTVTLSEASTATVTLSYTTSNGSATAGQDYTAGSGTVTFTPGVVSQVITVSVLGDTTVEPNETFTVTLSNPSGATIADASAVGTITNDDTASTPGGTAEWGDSFFAPYVDMGAYPVPNLLALSQSYGTSLMTLGFMQADADGNLAWAGLAALEPSSTNEQAIAINTSIATFKAAGGDVMISFGGASGTSIAQDYAAKGRSAQELADAYAAVVDTYGVTHLDFDIEGAAVADAASVTLNSQALALLQQAKPELEIWYTLPVLPTGLTADGLNVVDAALDAGVDLAGVNVMAMDYGESAAPTSGPNAKTMGAYAIESAESTHAQLTSLYAEHGLSFGWSQIGVTPMLGVNDVITEVFTIADAQALEDFANTNGIGMLSMWQVLRDTPGTLGQATTSASGLSDPAGAFSGVFNDYGTINVVDYDAGSTGGGGGGGTPVTGGTTTTITWAWGADAVLDFDPAKDTLDFVWMQPTEFDVAEESGSVLISIVGNNSSYTLQGVSLSQLQIGNIIANDAATVAKWQSLLDAAKAA
ncbi:glycosyl hydrolase family 18 protein [Mycobacterium sp. CVI_P3]|uniref:Glycosyl hydrolase family 18 protein n=1 Tax=Mycobacterium pinniadriaticum TaxID=2994102 RepID=A0ABT3SGJ1_9MYCO|nr:Calx-beta domain-containing protein [Mycobacterium pinniadriaticum]MCX2932270.1 glycosyl hydrolase family 18 protein [Mycobacterium pinniadriaticum]MCX2938630.1 glycosyl hydrolase family 18 protein [Mycobacterium pinniadriaticum]